MTNSACLEVACVQVARLGEKQIPVEVGELDVPIFIGVMRKVVKSMLPVWVSYIHLLFLSSPRNHNLDDTSHISICEKTFRMIYSPPQADTIWGIWGSYHNLHKAIFYLLKGDYALNSK